ncbi:MAG: RNA polymerase sigma factor [Acidobacteriales bacterium]|nr:RNA polymerase sigma factor [Terriglobales bacterium]
MTRPDSQADDADLIRASSRGDDAAFLLLYRRHQGPVFRFALHMSGRAEVAEEVTQEVFMSLVREPKAFRRERGALQAYLIGIARNKIRRYLVVDSVRAAALADPELRNELASSSDPFADCARAWEHAALRRAILSLPPRYREVTVLCELEEMPYAEAALLLGCAVGTVRSRLSRARKLLSVRLQKALGREVCPI